MNAQGYRRISRALNYRGRPRARNVMRQMKFAKISRNTIAKRVFALFKEILRAREKKTFNF